MSNSWAVKHRPTSWNQLQGNNAAVKRIRKWAKNFTPGDKAMLLHGEPGTGKTTTAMLVADELDVPLNSINTSEARRSDDIREIAYELAQGEQVVLLDEVDSWHHSANTKPLKRALEEARCPVVMTANSEYDVPGGLKRHAKSESFKLSKASIRAKLKKVAEKEKVDIDEHDLERLADRPALRSAINDLQLYADGVTPPSVRDREWDGSEFEAMDAVIQKGDAAPLSSLRPPWALLWLSENLTREYRGVEAAMAYDALSRADLHLGHVQDGDYRSWKFASALLECTPKLKLVDPYQGYIKWSFPQWAKGKVPRADDDSEESVLYHELNPSVSFAEFRHSELTLLQKLPKRERKQLALENGLSAPARNVLGISKSEWEEYVGTDDVKVGQDLGPDTQSAMEAEW